MTAAVALVTVAVALVTVAVAFMAVAFTAAVPMTARASAGVAGEPR